MNWKGTWRNQYGSILKITDDANGRLEGSFESAVEGSTKGRPAAIVGVYHGDLISFAFAAPPANPMVVAWTGLFRNGRMETLWHLVKGERLEAVTEGAPATRRVLDVWESIMTGADTFERKM